ncbi:hypothetical protein SDC9_87928 [bioreactor metagenome]|uniref:Uncharacterized protein n=1 Tax=bioreactor metagenome TaxID=1076179 RepID=A0A644ZLP6_9ZZZZ
MPFGESLLEGMMGRKVIVYNGFTLTYGFSPKSGFFKLVDRFFIDHFTISQYACSPSVQFELLQFLIIKIDIAILTLGQFQGSVKSVIKKRLLIRKLLVIDIQYDILPLDCLF